MLSIEAGCAWNASLLAGYQYDFDGWRWLAARSDPVGQAWDLMGNIGDQDHALLNRYRTRAETPKTSGTSSLPIMTRSPVLHACPGTNSTGAICTDPSGRQSYYYAAVDGMKVKEVGVQKPAPAQAPENPAQTFPQIEAVKLEGDAGDVSAKGHWEDGFWTVEFRRNLETPTGILTDSTFKRLTQFSVHVFDQVEGIDESSESERLFLEFQPEKPQLAKD